MKILAIRGKNLASLAGEFDVDFTAEPLASAGLFAISGPTGAGKSTLLDALCLALYNQTPRMANARGRNAPLPDVGGETIGPQDPRTLLRRGTAEGHAEVDFVGNDGMGYRARWSVRRARSRSGGKLQDAQLSLHRLADLQPVGGALKNEVLSNIHARIGLSFEQFTRAVLLAQNEFSAFLKADDDERAKLLQTLTGTDRFETISRRAFERNKAEQEALRVLNDRVATQRPLDAETRAHWERERAAREAAADATEARARLLEAHLRWHQEREHAVHAHTEGAANWQAAVAARDATQARRLRLGEVESAQAARPLVSDVDRLATQRTAQRQRADAAATDLQRAAATEHAALAALQQARVAVEHARQMQSAHAPALAQARELDAVIAARAPGHERARRDRDTTREARVAAQLRLAAGQDGHRQATDAHAQAERWLAGHASWAQLGQRWERWNTLFTQAGGLAHRATQAAGEASRLGSQVEQWCATQAQTRHRLDEASQRVAAARAALADLDTAIAGVDREALVKSKRAADARREMLAMADNAWAALNQSRNRRIEVEAEAADLTAAMARREALRQDAAALRPAKAAAEQQAHRSWQLALAASQASVESLRDALEDGTPCPVCGAPDHPYTQLAAPLRSVLTGLEAEHRRCREALATIDASEAEQRTLIAAHAQTLGTLREKMVAATRQLEEAQRHWQASPVAVEWSFQAADGDDAALTAWLAHEAAEADGAQRSALAGEETLRAFDRDAAALRQRLDQALATQERETVGVHEGEARVVELAARRDAAAAIRTEQEALLAVALDELDQAGLEQQAGADWRVIWRAAPEAFRAARQADAEAWSTRRVERDALAQRIGTLDAACTSAAETLGQAGESERAASAHFEQADRDLASARERRVDLFADTPYATLTVAAIDAVLTQALSVATQAMEAKQTAHQGAQHDHARVAEAAAQASQRLVALDAEAATARNLLTAWLAAWQPARFEVDADADVHADVDVNVEVEVEVAGEIEVAAGRGHALVASNPVALLRTHLAHDAGWIAGERAALQALDQDVHTRRAVVVERLAKLAQIDMARPTDAAVVEVQAEHAATSEALKAAKDLAAEAALTLRSDDERRAQGSALMADIEAQEKICGVWQSMNELIGAADGKKFRNFAQQLTLDILLGYANRHLAALSRRYRLERVRQSLALLVIDRDMADEVRSVHSLSGGESFLVSLALALGLASLSSHRVRVESLFIDEGFGSLDADTLRVAMDALDSLQAQGRKVGVISHVQEMTERIGTRIEIRRQPGGQSTLVMRQA